MSTAAVTGIASLPANVAQRDRAAAVHLPCREV